MARFVIAMFIKLNKSVLNRIYLLKYDIVSLNKTILVLYIFEITFNMAWMVLYFIANIYDLTCPSYERNYI